jgi:hypothetical protein
MAELFTATDVDGDELVVSQEQDLFVFTVRGEDGHRSVYLTDDDVRRLHAATSLTLSR